MASAVFPIARVTNGQRKHSNPVPWAFAIWTLPKPELEEGRFHLFVAIDYTSKFVMAKLTAKATMTEAQSFFKELIRAVPYIIRTVLTDNGIQFADTTKNRSSPTAIKNRSSSTAMLRGHPFGRVCRPQGIEQRLIRPNHPWTNGQVERMNRTLKEVTINRYFYQTYAQLQEHVSAFLKTYNFAKRLKTLRGLSPYEFIARTWTEKPELFYTKPDCLS